MSSDTTLKVHEDRTPVWRSLFIYTALFLALSFLVYFLFIVNGKTFLRYDSANRDAYAQRYMFTFEFKRFLENLFQGGTINTWDWSIGLGADGYAFNVSQLFSPSSYVMCFAPEKYIDVIYTAFIVLRVYLSGLFFLLFARKIGMSDYQVILGAVTYAFCPWIIKTTIYQGTFIKASMLFPLVMLGEEKIIRKESPLLFILSVGYVVLTIFSFAYMIALIVLLYFFIRMLTDGRSRSVLEVVKATAIFIMSGMAGIMTAGVGLMVTLLKFGETTGATGKTVSTLWTMTQYLRLPMRLMTWTSAFNSSSLIGISAVGIVMIPIIIYRVFKRDTGSIMTCLLFIFVLIPGVNSMFNYFSYPTGRWMFALAFFYSLAAASCFSEELLKDRKSKIAVTAVFAVYSVYLLWIQKILDRDVKLVVLVSWITCVMIILLIWVRYRNGEVKGHLVFDILITAVMCAGIAFSYNVKFLSEYPLYLDMGEAEKLMSASRQRVVQKIDDNGFYRVDQMIKSSRDSKNNEQMYFGNRSNYGFYSNIDVGWIEYNKLLDNSQSYYKRVRMRSNDNRFGLDLLQGTRYFIGNDNDPDEGVNEYAGYGFEPYDNIEGIDILKNRYFIGIGCAFSSYIREREWLKLSYADREAAMLMAVVVPDDEIMPSGMKEMAASDIDSGITECKYTIKRKKNGNKLIISADNDDDHQLLLSMINVKVAGNDPFELHVENDAISKSVTNSRGDERGYPNMRDFSVNLGRGEKAGKHIVIKLKGDGDAEKSGISYDDLIIYSMPLETYKKNAEVLVDNSLKVTQFNNDYIRGTITADSQRLLYLSILDNYGWDAYIDGRKVKTRDRMDIAFMGIDLEKGEHSIELRYHTRGFISGAVLSAAGILFAIFICFLHRKMYNNSLE